MGRERWSKERKIVAEILRELRKKKALSQVELACILDVAQSHISKYESGERALEIQEIRKVCLACDSNLDDFVERFESALATPQ